MAFLFKTAEAKKFADTVPYILQVVFDCLIQIICFSQPGLIFVCFLRLFWSTNRGD
jgi:hypothetical protein